jgi:hypothetical protein
VPGSWLDGDVVRAKVAHFSFFCSGHRRAAGGSGGGSSMVSGGAGGDDGGGGAGTASVGASGNGAGGASNGGSTNDVAGAGGEGGTLGSSGGNGGTSGGSGGTQSEVCPEMPPSPYVACPTSIPAGTKCEYAGVICTCGNAFWSCTPSGGPG